MIKLQINALLFHVDTRVDFITQPTYFSNNHMPWYNEHFLVGCEVCCREYGCKWFNAVVTTRSVWNIIKVKLNMFLRFLCCYLDENNFLFHHFYWLLSILELLTLSIYLYVFVPQFSRAKKQSPHWKSTWTRA